MLFSKSFNKQFCGCLLNSNKQEKAIFDFQSLDFNSCYRNIILYAFPFLYILIIGTFHFLGHIVLKRRRCFSFKKLRFIERIQFLLTFAMMILPWMSLILTIKYPGNFKRRNFGAQLYISSFIQSFSWIQSLLIYGYELYKSTVSISQTLYFFWLLSFLATALNLRTIIQKQITQHYSKLSAYDIMTIIQFSITALLQLISLFMKRRTQFSNPKISNGKIKERNLKVEKSKDYDYHKLIDGRIEHIDDTDICFSTNSTNCNSQRTKNRYKMIRNNNGSLIDESSNTRRSSFDYQKENTYNTSNLTRKHYEDYASLFSVLTFNQMSSLFVSGYKNQLKYKDFSSLRYFDQAKYLNDKFEQRQKHQLEKLSSSDRKPTRQTLVKSLNSAFGKTFWAAGIMKLFADMLLFVSPQILSRLISFVKNSNIPVQHGYGYATLMFSTAIMTTFILHQYFHRVFRVGMQLNTSLVASVYQKALKLSSSARHSKTTGEIVNLMSTDSQRIQDLFPYLHIMQSSPFQISLAIFFLQRQVGVSAFIGLAVMLFITIPVNLIVVKKVKKVQIKLMEIKDRRIKVTNEMLSSMKVIKLYAWEESFNRKISLIRKEELSHLRKYVILNSIFMVIQGITSSLVSLATFASFVLLGNTLTAEIAFTSLALFNIMRFPLTMLPVVINSSIESFVSLGRLVNFFNSSEIKNSSNFFNSNKEDFDNSLLLQNTTFYWDDLLSKKALEDINISIKPKQLVMVLGQVGSGKSAFLSSLIWDLELSNGIVNINGDIAYTSQAAQIQNASLRDNILFGKDFDEEFYDRVLFACALKPDIEILPSGDETEIGEKGINLSGGQKQRIALARAVYKRASIYLLDDTLSAVDAHVGQHIMKHCILDLLKESTVIFATNSLNYLNYADQIIVFEKGRIIQTLTYQEYQTNGLKTFLANKKSLEQLKKDNSKHIFENEEVEKIDGDLIDNETTKNFAVSDQQYVKQIIDKSSPTTGDAESYNECDFPSDFDRRFSDATIISIDSEAIKNNFDVSLNAEQNSDDKINLVSRKTSVSSKKDDSVFVEKIGGQLIDIEKREKGSVSQRIYMTYISATGGIVMIFAIVLSMLCRQSSDVGTQRWLAFQSDSNANAKKESESVKFYLGFYSLFAFGIILFTISNLIIVGCGRLRASGILHKSLLDSLLRAPMKFFDTTPIGRVLNRFASDIYSLDNLLPQALYSYLNCIFQVMTTILVIVVVSPQFSVALIPLALIYQLTQRYYIKTSRDLKRQASVLKSPIYSHFGETLDGVSTIRAFSDEKRFIKNNEEKINNWLLAFYPSVVANRQLAVRLEFVGTCVVGLASIFAVTQRGTISGGLAGMSISYALSVTQTLNQLVRMTADTENQVVSIERIKEYIDTESEAPLHIEDKKPDDHWPDKGSIQFHNFKLRYRPELDLVLNGLNAKIYPREKIGVVGRTGAGKSSLFNALLRVIEADDGSILIDDIDISHIGLYDLRTKLTIIPQDPVLFTGSIRFNIDPFNNCSDDEIQKALKLVHLDKLIKERGDETDKNGSVSDNVSNNDSNKNGLGFEVTEGGSNFSAGQRQLLCMARALLRNSRILLLDEATSAVDINTDSLIQETIRCAFSDYTVLTIAHRLETIMDSNRVMVMDKGKIVEFDSPQQLIKNPNSQFASITKAAFGESK